MDWDDNQRNPSLDQIYVDPEMAKMAREIRSSFTNRYCNTTMHETKEDEYKDTLDLDMKVANVEIFKELTINLYF